jgi:hypothetical protein
MLMTLDNYRRYASQCPDEAPVYIFDSAFGDRARGLMDDYTIPPVFHEDFFAILGSSRPDHMWLVGGPPRTGSSFHLDPYMTSAWNAVASGSKRWILYPPSTPPPGVSVGRDEEGDTSYDADEPIKYLLRTQFDSLPAEKRGLEIIQRAGEIIYVPSGWWHFVLNLEETVAVTQNHAMTSNFSHVHRDMLMPSNRKTWRKLRRRLRAVRPDLALKYNFEGADTRKA